MKPYAIINLRTFRAIKFDDRLALTDAMDAFKKQGIPYQPFKYDPVTDGYMPLAHY